VAHHQSEGNLLPLIDEPLPPLSRSSARKNWLKEKAKWEDEKQDAEESLIKKEEKFLKSMEKLRKIKKDVECKEEELWRDRAKMEEDFQEKIDNERAALAQEREKEEAKRAKEREQELEERNATILALVNESTKTYVDKISYLENVIESLTCAQSEKLLEIENLRSSYNNDLMRQQTLVDEELAKSMLSIEQELANERNSRAQVLEAIASKLDKASSALSDLEREREQDRRKEAVNGENRDILMAQVTSLSHSNAQLQGEIEILRKENSDLSCEIDGMRVMLCNKSRQDGGVLGGGGGFWSSFGRKRALAT